MRRRPECQEGTHSNQIVGQSKVWNVGSSKGIKKTGTDEDTEMKNGRKVCFRVIP